MTFMARKKLYGKLPYKKPNRHRLNASGIPLKYPSEVWAIRRHGERKKAKREIYEIYRRAI